MQWSEKESTYIAWLAVPEDARPDGMETREDIAKVLDVTTDVLWAWEHKTGFWDEVFSKSRGIVGRAMPSILTSMTRRAQQGSVQAAKLCFQLLGVHADKLDINLKKNDDRIILIMPEDEYEQSKQNEEGE